MDPFGLFYQIILSVKVTILDIDQQYLDDISKLSEKMKDELPVKIAQQGLKINEKKQQRNIPLKDPTVIIVGEIVNYLVTIKAANKMKHLLLNDLSLSILIVDHHQLLIAKS